jgi:aspartate/methionine/tyrosine aminotransferase
MSIINEANLKISKFEMERWLMGHRFNVKYNLAESGVRDITVGRLLEYANEQLKTLNDIILEDEDTRGTLPLRQLIAGSYNKVSPDNVLVTTGTSEALFTLFNVLLSKGDTIIAEKPGFQALWQIPVSINCNVCFIELTDANKFQLDANSVEKLVDRNTRLIIINTPHNPSGSIRPLSTIKQIIDVAKAVGAIVLVDEHYRFLPLDQTSPLPSAADLLESNVVVSGSITKCFGMIGLRVGWLIGSEAILEECRSYRDYLTHVLSPVTDRLTRIAFQASNNILNENIKMIQTNRDILESFIRSHCDYLSWTKPMAGAVAFLRLIDGTNADDFCNKMINQASVFLLPGSSFGYHDYFRICLGLENTKFKEALERVDHVLSRN